MLEFIDVINKGFHCCFPPVFLFAVAGAVFAWRYGFSGWRAPQYGRILILAGGMMMQWRILLLIPSSRYFAGSIIPCILLSAWIFSCRPFRIAHLHLDEKNWNRLKFVILVALVVASLGKAMPRNSKKEMIDEFSALLEREAGAYCYPALFDSSGFGNVIAFYSGGISVWNIADVQSGNAKYWLTDKPPYHDGRFFMFRKSNRKAVEQWFSQAGISPQLLSRSLKGAWDLYLLKTPESQMGYKMIETESLTGGKSVFSDTSTKILEGKGFCRYDLPGSWEGGAYHVSFTFSGRRGLTVLFIIDLYDEQNRLIGRETKMDFYCVYPNEIRQIRFNIPPLSLKKIRRKFTIATYDGPLSIGDIRINKRKEAAE